MEKALPAMLRQRFATTQEEIYPNANKYWTIWSFWNQTVTPARAINEAMNPEKVGTFAIRVALLVGSCKACFKRRVTAVPGWLDCSTTVARHDFKRKR